MRTLMLASVLTLMFAAAVSAETTGPYHIIRSVKVGGEGGFDYVYADSANRKLYVPRSGPAGHIMVFDLDSLKQVGDLTGINAHGAAVDSKSGHGFSTSKPIGMWDARTLQPMKPIDVQGNPDGILFDASSQRLYSLSHSAPQMTVIDTNSGAVVGTVDLGGAPEQAQSDGAGHLYVDIEDKGQVAVVDTKTLTVTNRFDLGAANLTPAGLALDAKNHILFAACRNPAQMVILNADSGKILATLPLGVGTDGAGFNPTTMEAFSSQGDGTLTVIKENSPTSFAVEETLPTQIGAKTMTIDAKTGHIFLIAAEYGPPPAPAPDAPPGRGPVRRGPMIPGSFAILEVGK